MSNKVSIQNETIDFDTVVDKIEAGEFLIIAADESVLSQLPSGNWIGGTTPYSMTEEGGTVSRDKIFVHSIVGCAQPRITPYDQNSISRIAQDAPDNGFTITILPYGSDVHSEYSQNAPSFPNMFFSPIIGWIAGFHLDDIDTHKAKTVFGPGKMLMEDKAVAMHIALPDSQFADIHIVNLFEQGAGPKITFPKTGFEVDTCLVDGVETNFSEFVTSNNIDVRLPLVADYNGINVNVSILNVASEDVSFYAPVFENMSYQFAAPVGDYVAEFDKAINSEKSGNSAFSCNCILNFLYSELEGKKTGSLTGPIVFGEVAYQLVNQTLVYMTLENQ
ncbi:MAG: hypothetical protein V7785_12475 [Bermanella sp.]